MAKSSNTDLPTLVHPDGREYTPSSAQEATNLVSAEGYSVKGGGDLPDAFAEGKAKLAKRIENGTVGDREPATTSGEPAKTGKPRTGTDTAASA